MPTPFDTLYALRKSYEAPLSPTQLGQLLNAVAWAHRNAGWGLYRKPNGAHVPQPKTGIPISQDILVNPTTKVYVDCLSDAEGQAKPVWQEHADPNADPTRFVAPVDYLGDTITPVKPPVELPPSAPDSSLQAQIDQLEFRLDVTQKALELVINRLNAPIRTTTSYYHSHEVKL